MVVTQAKRFLEIVEAGMGFDEVPVGDGDYVPRDIPMSAARHAALAICSSMNVRFNIGEHVEEGVDRNDIVDELTEIIQLASGPGPFNIDVALALNETHRTIDLNGGAYGVKYEDNKFVTYAGNGNMVNTTHVSVADTPDALFTAVRQNLDNFKMFAGGINGSE